MSIILLISIIINLMLIIMLKTKSRDIYELEDTIATLSNLNREYLEKQDEELGLVKPKVKKEKRVLDKKVKETPIIETKVKKVRKPKEDILNLNESDIIQEPKVVKKIKEPKIASPKELPPPPAKPVKKTRQPKNPK